jgi:uncharacterized surface protein with fasciclin (FAS1) repeats
MKRFWAVLFPAGNSGLLFSTIKQSCLRVKDSNQVFGAIPNRRRGDKIMKYLLTGALALVLAPMTFAADIVDTAVAAKFNTLVAAVKAAGLVDTLKGTGPFTVFAPTDEAFAKLPHGTVEDLLKPENKEKLTAILTYHVVPGKVTAAQVMKLNSAKTVQGDTVTIKKGGGGVMVNNARVVKADVMADNGVVHVIDAVLLPQ